jgi:outer membrane protein OmpA-like peptidoglycan-associated protein
MRAPAVCITPPKAHPLLATKTTTAPRAFLFFDKKDIRTLFIASGLLFLLCTLGSAQGTGKSATIEREIRFSFAKSDIRPAHLPMLDSLAAMLLADAGTTLTVEAHTDAAGSDSFNILLARQRAVNIQSFFEKKGISPDRISCIAHGESRPISDNTTRAGMQKNRRATLTLRTAQKETPAPPKEKEPEPIGQAPTADTPCGDAVFIVLDEKTLAPLAARAIVRRNNRSDTLFSDKKGRFQIALVAKQTLDMEFSAQGHMFKKAKAAFDCHPAETTVLLQPLEVGGLAELENIYFVSNVAELMPKSMPTLEALLRFMKENPLVEIQINGHVNYPYLPPVDIQSGEFKLSERRAEAVRDYLVKNGVAKKRMSCKGYGNHRMKYPNAITPAEEEANRRVEIVILKNGN